MKLSLIGKGLARLTFSDGSALTTNMRVAGETLEGQGYKRAFRGFAGAMSRRWYRVQANNANDIKAENKHKASLQKVQSEITLALSSASWMCQIAHRPLCWPLNTVWSTEASTY